MAEKFEKSEQQVSILETKNAKLKWCKIKIKRSVVKHLVRLLLKEEESKINKKEDVNRGLRIKMKNIEVYKALWSSSSLVPFLVSYSNIFQVIIRLDQELLLFSLCHHPQNRKNNKLSSLPIWMFRACAWISGHPFKCLTLVAYQT